MVNNLDFLCHDVWCSVGVVDGLPRAGSHYNLGGTYRGPDKIWSAPCTWLIYAIKGFGCVQVTYKNWAGVLLIVFYSLPESVDAHIGFMFLFKTELII